MALVATQAASTTAVGDLSNPYADVIVPPPSIREVVDKTATFVAKNGFEFEVRMMREANAAERFAFLFPGHSYRQYYELKVREVQQGRTETVQTVIPKAVADMWQKEQEKQKKSLMLKGHAEKDEFADFSEFDLVGGGGEPDDRTTQSLGHSARPNRAPPPAMRFVLKHPYIAPIDSDIIKLTAQFVACNGHSFLAGLIQRERSNPQFEFLRQHHPTHSYFNELVESYSKCLNLSTLPLKELRLIVGDDGQRIDHPPLLEASETEVVKLKEERRIRLLAHRMTVRYQWEAEQDAKKRATEEADAEERAAMAAIDWDDFVVVETIVFTEADANACLPAPVNYSEEEQKCVVAPMPMLQAPNVPASHAGGSVPLPPRPTPTIMPMVSDMPLTTTTTVDGEQTRIVLRPEYVRRGKRSAVAGKYLKCPMTGQLVPAEEMTQHLKVMLIDSKWKKQRDELLARAQKESVYAPEADVETNIAQFVLKRPDLFGTVEDEILEHASDPLTGTGVPPSTNARFADESGSGKRSRYS